MNKQVASTSRSWNQELISVGLILGFAGLTALSAQIHIPLPFTPVPMTLQTVAVILAGLTLGAWHGALSQITYLAGGALGLPLFAGGASLAALLGPTGGYLIGFIASAFAAGLLKPLIPIKTSKIKAVTITTLVALLASVPCFALGALWLKTSLNVSGMTAFTLGVAPFLLGDFVKSVITALIYQLKNH